MIQISQPVFGPEEYEAIRQVLDSGWVTQGPKVGAFERAFASRHGVRHAVAVTSCTTGLHLALAATGIGPGDEVIVPAFTWITTANVVIHTGATPILVDVDRETYNIDLSQVAARVTARTRAVIPVHLFGLCVDVEALRALLPAGVRIIEDAACATGAACRGRSAGALGDAGVFSFHPRKSITTGEGGMITTDDDDLAELLRSLRNHGATISEEDRHRGPQPYSLPDFAHVGYNYRMTDLQGALGLVQLGRLDGFIAERNAAADHYRERLADLPWLRTPRIPDGCVHGWQAYVCYVDPGRAPVPRNPLMKFLQDEHGVSTRPGTHAVHTLGVYRERFGYTDDDYPGARDCHANAIALPLHNRMTADDYTRVIDALHAVR